MGSLKLPTFSQWRNLPKILSKKEKISLFIFLILAVFSFIFLITDLYFKNTKIAPANGGIYREGAVGQPRFINPIYGETNDVDRNLIELLFSGLMSYDDYGNIVKDLADDYIVSEDGKTYEFKLKENVFWHDGKPLTAEDIVFTIKTIQNPDYKSPLRANWLDVETEIISDYALRFKLKSPYNSFLENCTVKIIPKHIWENVAPENFPLSFYNLQPVGCGPYKFQKLGQTKEGFIKMVALEKNKNYYGKSPNISEIEFWFFKEKEELIKAAEKKQIDGYSAIYLNGNYPFNNFSIKYFSSPRYFALFFNTQNSKIFSDPKIRKALNYSINKQEMIEILESSFSPGKKENVKAYQIIDSPILPDFFNYNKPKKTYEFNIANAEELLDGAGFKINENGKREKIIEKKPAFQFTSNLAVGSKGKEVEELQKCLSRDPELYQGDITGSFGTATKEAVAKFQKKHKLDIVNFGAVGKTTRTKLNEICSPPSQENILLQFTISTVNQPQLIKTAEILKSQWEKIGATIEIKTMNPIEIRQIIKDRNYDALLYGEALGMLFDPYPFWYSTQKNDPGLNLSKYENKEVDKLLKEGRETLKEDDRKMKYEKFQEILIEDAPAVFLYNLNYIYLISGKIKGIETEKIVDPSKRFSNVENWYIRTKRIWR